MQKFLSIPITATGETRQLLAIDNIIILEQATTTTVTISYGAGAALNLATITHTAMDADDVSVRDRLQDSIVSALSTSWQHPSYDVSLSGLVSAADGTVAITAVAVTAAP